jgi:hypothetical protein
MFVEKRKPIDLPTNSTPNGVGEKVSFGFHFSTNI